MAELSDGTSTTAEVNYGDEYGVGWARLKFPEGVTVVAARSE